MVRSGGGIKATALLIELYVVDVVVRTRYFATTNANRVAINRTRYIILFFVS